MREQNTHIGVDSTSMGRWYRVTIELIAQTGLSSLPVIYYLELMKWTPPHKDFSEPRCKCKPTAI